MLTGDVRGIYLEQLYRDRQPQHPRMLSTKHNLPDRAVANYTPPAIAGIILTSSPSLRGVAAPSKKRISSLLT